MFWGNVVRKETITAYQAQNEVLPCFPFPPLSCQVLSWPTFYTPLVKPTSGCESQHPLWLLSDTLLRDFFRVAPSCHSGSSKILLVTL